MPRVMQKVDPNQSFVNKRRHILTNHSSFHVQEAYKALRTNIRFFLSSDRCKKFCITSSAAGEGKSITILNLAISFAQTGQKVLLIDADMRRPSLAKLLIEKPAPGLSNVLAGLNNEDEAIRKGIYENLDIMFAGDLPPNPSELLGSENMQRMLERVEKRYDYILVDLPPVGVVTDACVVANSLDGVLFLVRQNSTERDAIKYSIKQLELSGANLMGFVFNGAPTEGKSYNNKYRYSYESAANAVQNKLKKRAPQPRKKA